MGKKKKRKNNILYFDYSLVFMIVFVCGFGLMMIYSASSYSAQMKQNDPAFFFKRQLLYDLVGLVGMIVAYFVDYHKYKRFAWLLVIASIISIFLVYPLGKELNGARRWVYFGPISFQPAEFLKMSMIIGAAVFLSRNHKLIQTIKGVGLFLLVFGGVPLALLLFVTSNMSSAIIVVLIMFVMSFVVYPDLKAYIVAGAAAILGYIGMFIFEKSRLESGDVAGDFRDGRMLTWVDPERFKTGSGFQTVQALYAIGSGGLFGKGLGKSLQKLGYIPESQNDMIFSIICEEFGLFGAFLVIAIFAIIIWRIVRIAQNAPDLLGTLLATGVFAHVAIQVVLNIAVVTNFIPNTGVSLPLISYGGTASIFMLIEIGIVLNISRQMRLGK